MIMRAHAIGGDMAIQPDALQSPMGAGAWPAFVNTHQLRCDTGRSALKIALLDWRCKNDSLAPGCVWIPSYICSSVRSAVDQLELPVCVYVDMPGTRQWQDLPQPAPGDLVLVVHYFGLINHAAISWIDAQRDRRWTLLEDCVQSPYTAGAGTRGEYAITSLRKWWPAPDGAIVAARDPFSGHELHPPNEAFLSCRVTAKLLRGNDAWEASYLALTEESEALLENDVARETSWISTRLLASADVAAAASARRTNWVALAEGLSGNAHVTPLYRSLGNREVPLVFPIALPTAHRDRLRGFLGRKRIYCPVHWPMQASQAEQDLSHRILSLPLDQRYGLQDMHYVAACVNEYFAEGFH